jgi:lipopolysaccharide export system protein LptA
MRLPAFFFTALLALPAHSQTNRGPLRVYERAKSAEATDDTARKIQSARENGRAENVRTLSEQATDAKTQKELAAKAAEAASNLMRKPDLAEAERSRQTDRALDEAMKNASTAGKILLAQGAKAAPTTAPEAAGSVTAAVPSARAAIEPAGEPKPMPMKPVSLEDPAAKGKDQVVITSDALYFDANGSIAIFLGNVQVKHPQFYLTCHEMEVHTNKDETAKETEKKDEKEGGKAGALPPAVANPVAANPSAAGAPAQDNGGIKMAIAKGPMVVIEKLTETGDVQVGVCKHATYIGATEEIIMRDYPQVQRGNMLDKATDPATRMILKPSGDYKRDGKGTFEMIQEDKKRKPTHLAPLPSQQSPGNASRAPAPASGSTGGAINLPPPAGL